MVVKYIVTQALKATVKKGWLKKELQKKSTQSFKSLMKELKTDWKKRTGPSGKK